MMSLSLWYLEKVMNGHTAMAKQTYNQIYLCFNVNF